MIAGPRLRAGRANSAKGAARMVAQPISTARAISADTTILVRGDSAFGSRAVVGTCIRHGAQFSVAMARNSAIDKAIAAIGDRLDPVLSSAPRTLDCCASGCTTVGEVAAARRTAGTAGRGGV